MGFGSSAFIMWHAATCHVGCSPDRLTGSALATLMWILPAAQQNEEFNKCTEEGGVLFAVRSSGKNTGLEVGIGA